jgi:uncharacterized membrane protein
VSASAEIASEHRPSDSVTARVRTHAWPIVVWVSMAAWSLVLFGTTRDAYLQFRVGRFDLGNMVQAVWSTAEGRPLEVTHGSTGEQIVRLGGHADPFLVLLTPLWMVWPSPLSLAFAQIVIVSLGALPVFWLGRRHVGDETVAGLLALGYLAYPWVATSAYAAIHPVTFAIPLLLFGIWFLDTDRLVLFGACALLVMSTGELMGLPVAALGVWFALARGRRVEGAVTTAAGLTWTVVAVYVIVPMFGGGHSMFYGFYDGVGGSPQGVIRTLFTHPGTVLGALVEGHDIVYLVWLGLPLLFLFVLSPWLALAGLPQLLANMLSDFRSMSDPRYHSVAAVIPFLIAATVLAVAKIRPERRRLAAAGVLVSSASLAIVLAPWPRAVGVTPLGGRETLPAARVRALTDAVALVPRDAPVTASNGPGAHLSARRYVYVVPTLRRASWAVIDLADPWVAMPDSPLLTQHPRIVRRLVATLERDPSWEKVFERAGVVVFKRTSAH